MRELVKSGVLGADGVCMTFMKQIAGEFGDRRMKKKGQRPEARGRRRRRVKCLGVSVPASPLDFPSGTGLFWEKEMESSHGVF